MNELITIGRDNIGGEIVQTVNARDLHSFLEVGKDFSNWIKNRIGQYGFTEGSDFLTVAQTGVGGKFASTEYHITIDMGKELAMVERNAKGKEARLYFLECERRAKAVDPMALLNDPTAMRGLLLSYSEKVLQLESANAEMTPKAEFFDAVTDSTDAIDIGTVAKVLNCGIGRTRLFQFLREEKILMGQNQPYQQYIDCGYFRVIESKYSKPDGSNHINMKTVVYQKGVEFIRKRLAAKN